MIEDNHTSNLYSILKNIFVHSKESHKQIYFSGGFAIDFHACRITRDNKDIELYVNFEDMDYWKKWFENQGYYCVKQHSSYTYSFVVKPTQDANIKFLDVHAYKINENGFIIIFNSKNGEEIIQNYKFNEEIKLVDFNELKGIPILSVKLLKYYKQKRLIVGKDPQAKHDLDILNNVKVL